MKNRISSISVSAWTIVVLAMTTLQSLAQSIYESYTFITLAGNAGYGSADGAGSAARFNHPRGVAVDSAGNVYVADGGNYTIRKVTPAGVVTTLAGLAGRSGNADGTGTAARFGALVGPQGPTDGPNGVVVDGAGNVYVADRGNDAIRKVTPEGVVTTLAGGFDSYGEAQGGELEFADPVSVAVDSAGNVYVADGGNNTIRKVTPAGVVTTLAGLAGADPGSADGTGSVARFNYPSGVAVDSAGNVFVADGGNNTIRKVTPAGVVTTLAGLAGQSGNADGTGSDARFSGLTGVAVDSAGNVYVTDPGNRTIRKMTAAGVVTTLAGLAPQYDNNGNLVTGGSVSVDGTGSEARFNYPSGVAVDSAGNVYVADYWNNTIRKVTPAGVVTTLAGLAGGSGSADGTGSDARFAGPSGVAVDSAGNVYVADSYVGDSGTIRKVTPAGAVTTLAGMSRGSGSADGTASEARFFYPAGVAVDSVGNVYVADYYNHTIRKVTPAGVVTTLAGNASITNQFGFPAGAYADGTGSGARFNHPSGVAVDSAGNVYVADLSNNTIRKVTPSGVVTTLAGLAGSDGSTDGTGSAARFNYPNGVAVDSSGSVYVADSGNNAIRKVTSAGVVTTLAGLPGTPGSADGKGSDARFANPSGVAVDSAGNVYVTDAQTIRKVTPTGVVTTLAGLAQFADGNPDGTGSEARFAGPAGIAVDITGNVYVADSGNYSIRKGYPVLMILNSILKGGQFGFNLTGPAGKSVVVESSSDLLTWLPLWTNTFTGALNFSDPQSAVSSHHFYRARTP